MVTIKRKPDFRKNLYERQAWQEHKLVCGIDEVGRSCLSGPVVAAAAMLKPKARHKLLKDSKMMTALQRQEVYTWLMKHSTYAVGIIHHRLIDQHNIYHATLRAMKRALVQMLAVASKHPSIILVDAMPVKLDHLEIPVVHFTHGESKSTSIAAASIIAKVTRDALMGRVDQVTPGYAYVNNKGYGTKAHRAGIDGQGLTVLHRMSFITNKKAVERPMSLFQVNVSEKLI